MTSRDIILISSLGWDFPWQGHQEIATRLARAGDRVLYVENTGVRTPRSLAVYYCVADSLHLTPYARQLRRSERAVVEACDLVFAQGEELADHRARWNANVHAFPFGVNTEGFAAGARRGAPQNGAGGNGSTYDDYFNAISRPVIGYVGGLHRQSSTSGGGGAIS
ncbi:MAG: hypothetical protein LC746_03630 [Acidobacteria bacterium]|nr:hypothetical protein [Acidobacteriota bacterium]